MGYQEAVELALKEDQRGFSYLYEETYQSKYYLALKYMKNEEAAQDILQDSYVKAFLNLDKLKDPEAFASWFGMIVANTAKNALQKKEPLLFTDIKKDEEETFDYEVEDKDIHSQPELSYTEQETKELVHEMIGSLSDEQRMCILMYYIEELKIKEIAKALDCSENTVKSRLKYGKGNLRKKAEDLQKKGYNLYSTAPIILLVYLLHKEEKVYAAEGVFDAIKLEDTKSHIANHKDTKKILTEKNVSTGSKIAGKGLLATTAAKTTAVIVAVAVIGAGTAFGITKINKEDRKPVVTKTEKANTKDKDTKKAETKKEIKEEDYPSLIAGELTKEELQFVLAYGPSKLSKDGLTSNDYKEILAKLCQGSYEKGIEYITSYDNEGYQQHDFSLADINRFYQSFTSFQYTKDNIEENGEQAFIREDRLSLSFNVDIEDSLVAINKAYYTKDEATIFYTIKSMFPGDSLVEYQCDKKAILKPTKDGKYRITEITDDGNYLGRYFNYREPIKLDENNNLVGEAYFPFYGVKIDADKNMTITSAAMVSVLGTQDGDKEDYSYQLSKADTGEKVPDGVSAYLLRPTNDKNLGEFKLYYDSTEKVSVLMKDRKNKGDITPEEIKAEDYREYTNVKEEETSEESDVESESEDALATVEEYPTGRFWHNSNGGGGERLEMVIDKDGVANFSGLMSGTGETFEFKYQMSRNDTEEVPQGVIAYDLTLIDGEGYDLNSKIYYDSNTGCYYDDEETYGWGVKYERY